MSEDKRPPREKPMREMDADELFGEALRQQPASLPRVPMTLDDIERKMAPPGHLWRPK